MSDALPVTDQTEATLDTTALDAIRALDETGAAGLLRQIVQLYFQTTPRLIGELRQAQAAGSLEEVRNAAHSLKSSSANLGATRLAQMCKSVEHAARAGALHDALPDADAIEREYAAVRGALERALAS